MSNPEYVRFNQKRPLPERIRDHIQRDVYFSPVLFGNYNANKKTIELQGYVYMAHGRDGTDIKIGFSRNMPMRMKQICGRCIFYQYATFAHELAIHRTFRHLCIGNEWYSLTYEQALYIRDLLRPPGAILLDL